MDRLRVSVAIMAHNEEANIGALLEVVLESDLAAAVLEEVVVVSSASVDRTDEIVASFTCRDSRVHLVTEPERRGKNNAINLYFEHHRPVDVIVLLSGDVLPRPDAISRMVAAFEDPSVGMVGGRPVPVNDPDSLLGFTAHLIWAVHHRIALQSPKLGEAVAFRDVIDSLPPELAVDEAALEALLTAKDYRLHYVPEAIIRNRGPERVREFLTQRRRITAGHLHLRDRLGYRVSTESPLLGLRLFPVEMIRGPRQLMLALIGCSLIFIGRVLGWYDYVIRRKTHQVWEIASTTKRVTTSPAGSIAGGSSARRPPTSTT